MGYFKATPSGRAGRYIAHHSGGICKTIVKDGNIIAVVFNVNVDLYLAIRYLIKGTDASCVGFTYPQYPASSSNSALASVALEPSRAATECYIQTLSGLISNYGLTADHLSWFWLANE
ncbi:hypothetical protein KQX54_018068 [Cotesia glomerata]|uniref:Uncharacterized protein n=1 Tax=Cotesia glomerata TaxID=32391 RepID=A0AAV7HWC3_COTGL|nr:hypothetical protein KQX54_018068 [Cotesia glomerata]